MKQQQPRRLWLIPYWFVLILTFCIASFFLLTAAMGYRYNPEFRKWQKTSILVADLNPRDSKLNLDGKVYPLNGSKRLYNILPGIYHTTVTKGGYIPWQSYLTLRSGYVEELPKVTLFFQHPEELASTLADRQLLESGYIDPKIQLSNGELRYGTRLVTRFANPPVAAALLSTDNHLAYIIDDEIHIIGVDGTNDQIIYRRRSSIPTKIMANGNRLIFEDDGLVQVIRIR